MKQPCGTLYKGPLVNLKKYFIITGFMALIASPAAVSLGLVGIMLIVPPIIVLALVWVLYVKRSSLPEKASELFLPFFIVLCYYTCVWIVLFGLSGYHLDSGIFSKIFMWLTFPYIVIHILMAIGGIAMYFPVVNAAITTVTVLSIIITCKICKKKIIMDKKIIIYGLVFICLSGIAACQYYDRSTKILSIDYRVERIEDEVDLSFYHPFYEKNLLKRLNDLPTVIFTEDYPRLDGATAAYPVYGAMVQELYKGLDRETVKEYIRCSNTSMAYERLIEGEIDIFFGAQPSKQQYEAAKEKGVELNLIPIAKEAFVFFVNKENPVNSLTLPQIQDIYQKKIINWKDLGGKTEKIIPFQRPKNSGSQTVMLAMVMGEKVLPPPLKEESASGMGGIINRVAAYRNYSSSIGYSFRFFATGMKPNENIKLLAINGIMPSVENIQNGVYPFTVDVYAVTAGSANENTEKLIEWILSEQGQGFIETCGYVRK